ncbi:MAG: DUF2207 domain-containing protein [Clostridia bacterium]|nr:DUF2207 domain-containing protein [Clostridia bacterium]
MKKIVTKIALCLSAVVLCLLTAFGLTGGAEKQEERITAALSANTSAPYAINRLVVNAEVTEDRKIIVVEELDVEVFRVGSQKIFYKSLPIEGDRFYDVWAKGINNPDFSYEVADNPDVDGFLDVNCKGGVEVGAKLTYQFGYTLMMSGEDVENGMIVDFVGAGCPVPIRNVTVNVKFPARLAELPKIYCSAYGEERNDYVEEIIVDEDTLTLKASVLPLSYNETFGESMAAAISVQFVLEEGGLQSYFASLWSGPALWLTIGLSLLPIVVGVLCFVFVRKRREIVTVVNLSAPDKMDPLEMGALLDGRVDNEDVSSMLYYFAEGGYLNLSFDNADDPKIIKVKDLPDDVPAYQKILFNGLFESGNEVFVSQLKDKYYQHVEKAKVLISPKTEIKKRYEKKSVLATIGCAVFALLGVGLIPFIVAKAFIHHTYTYFPGLSLLFTAAFAVGSAICLYAAEELRFKGKGRARKALIAVAVALSLVGWLVGTMVPSHVVSHLEKGIMYLAAYVCVWLGALCLTRTQTYCETLGEILGFKEFIVVTEEDKIKFMLEENPNTYYHILPYAQVLGVTDEWEEKFKDLTLEPPSWCVGNTDVTFFDYYILTRSMRMMSYAMYSRPQVSGGSVGRSGGGGSFGGFSGGGHGGGGFGMR